MASVETLTLRKQHVQAKGTGWRAGYAYGKGQAGEVSGQVCIRCRGSEGQCWRYPMALAVPLCSHHTWDLVAWPLMWFLLGGWRNESYSVAFHGKECVI